MSSLFQPCSQPCNNTFTATSCIAVCARVCSHLLSLLIDSLCAGALHGVNTQVDDDDFDDVVLGARIGRTCYEMYHQTASGLAPDSVTYKRANGQQLPSRDQDTVRPPGTIKHRPGARCVCWCWQGE